MKRELAQPRASTARHVRFALGSAYLGRLLAFLRRKGRSHEDAEDLAQEAMLRLHLYRQAAPVVDEEAFLRHAAHNLSIDQHRRDRPDLRQEFPIEELDARSALVAPERTPEEMLETEQRLNTVRAILDAVSVRTREIYLAHRAGYSYAEIADHMNISRCTIKRHIARALVAIMEHDNL